MRRKKETACAVSFSYEIPYLAKKAIVRKEGSIFEDIQNIFF